MSARHAVAPAFARVALALCAMLAVGVCVAGAPDAKAVQSAPAMVAAKPGAAASPTSTRPWRVLILNASDPTLPAFIAIDTAMRSALTAPGQHPVEIFAETLDMLRFPQGQIDGALRELLTRKYARQPIDIVIAAAGPALDFALDNRAALWPQARIVFHTVMPAELGARKLPPLATGIPVLYDIAGTAALAVRLDPALKRIVVVGGSSDYDVTVANEARAQLAARPPPVPVEFWTGRELDALMADVAHLGPHDAIVYLMMFRDPAGRTFVPREVLRHIADTAPAPVYGIVDTYLGAGMVAGSVESYAERGRRVAEAVFTLMAAPPGTELPVLAPAPSRCLADGSRLEAHRLRSSALPPDCNVQFEPPSLWREYRWYVVAALVAVVGQSLLILALVLQRRARRHAEREARARRAELAHASRLALAGELTASIAHEMNQPLGAMLANAGAAEKLLEARELDRAELADIVGDIRRDSLRARDIIVRVRGLVTARDVTLEPVDLVALVGDTTRLIAGEARRRGATIAHASDVPALVLRVDRIQIQQVIVILCMNALDAMADIPAPRRRATVEVARAADGGATLVVTDHGPGIAADALLRLFESFFSTKQDGMGLGLSIARNIVEAHGGRLTARNVTAGGAEFTVTLPPDGAA